jgi:hypothetical protein
LVIASLEKEWAAEQRGFGGFARIRSALTQQIRMVRVEFFLASDAPWCIGQDKREPRPALLLHRRFDAQSSVEQLGPTAC